MKNASGQRTRVLSETTIKSAVLDQSDNRVQGKAVFSTTGRVMEFDGFLRVYEYEGEIVQKYDSDMEAP